MIRVKLNLISYLTAPLGPTLQTMSISLYAEKHQRTYLNERNIFKGWRNNKDLEMCFRARRDIVHKGLVNDLQMDGLKSLDQLFLYG